MSEPGHRTLPPARPAILLAALCSLTVPALSASAEEPLAIRVESLLVAPAHSPSVTVLAKNRTAEEYRGTLALEVPADWTIQPAEQSLVLAPGETSRLRYLLKSGVNRADNAYPLTVTATSTKGKLVHRQTIAVASAPYFKAEIDGRTEDWADALPVVWLSRGLRTTVSTYWNRRQFCLLVAVEEERRTAPGVDAAPFDAVQIAISAEDSVTGNDAQAKAGRYEFLLTGSEQAGPGRCYLLADPQSALADTQSSRPLDRSRYDEAQVWVWHDSGTTFYECALPWSLMRDQVPPGEGREFRFSLLVHDPDGSGLRDWGEACGLWTSERNRLAWSNWAGAAWPAAIPFDNKIAWGMCSSKY